MSDKRIGWDCQQDDCTRTVNEGPLYRMTPKGIPGVFFCREHAEQFAAGPA